MTLSFKFSSLFKYYYSLLRMLSFAPQVIFRTNYNKEKKSLATIFKALFYGEDKLYFKRVDWMKTRFSQEEKEELVRRKRIKTS